MSIGAARRFGMIVVCQLFGLAIASRAVGTELLANASFEMPVVASTPVVGAPGAPWIGFNIPESRVTSRTHPRTGLQSVQTIGPFDFIGGGAGGHQTVPAAAGALYTGSIYALNPSADPMERSDFGFISLIFLDANLNFVDVGLGTGVSVNGLNHFLSTSRLFASSPRDIWTPLRASGKAPAGTAFARLTFAKIQLGNGRGGFVGGTTYWDDASLTAVPEPGGFYLMVLGATFAGMWRARRAERPGLRRGLVS